MKYDENGNVVDNREKSAINFVLALLAAIAISAAIWLLLRLTY